MTSEVHILATRLPGGSLDAMTLTFRTLRIGFPTLPVTIWANELDPEAFVALEKCAVSTRANVRRWMARTSHDIWVSALLKHSPNPFWIADTDLVFRTSVEGFATSPLAGRFEPEFQEPWSRTRHIARLHTSLLYFDPVAISQKVRLWMARWHPRGFPFRPIVELVQQSYVPVMGESPLFYDTCAALYQAIGGVAFTPDQNTAFDHLHCATYVQNMDEAIPGLREAHVVIYKDPLTASSLSSQQSTFYKEHAIQ